jgi:hypothetical protein
MVGAVTPEACPPLYEAAITSMLRGICVLTHSLTQAPERCKLPRDERGWRDDAISWSATHA